MHTNNYENLSSKHKNLTRALEAAREQYALHVASGDSIHKFQNICSAVNTQLWEADRCIQRNLFEDAERFLTRAQEILEIVLRMAGNQGQEQKAG